MNPLTKPCIQAPGRRDSQGYGVGRTPDGKRDRAHRIAYRAHHGEIPPQHTIDHLCHNADPACPGGRSCLHRGCIEPSHLEAVTTAVNVVRGKGDRRTHCNNGHELTEANTYYAKGRIRSRRCRVCIRAHSAGKRSPEANAKRRAAYAAKRGASYRPLAEARAANQCIHGHEFTVSNTYLDPRGHRHCRTCQRERERAYRERRRPHQPRPERAA